MSSDHDMTVRLRRHFPTPDPRDALIAFGMLCSAVGAAGLGRTAFCIYLVVVGALTVVAAIAASLR